MERRRHTMPLLLLLGLVLAFCLPMGTAEAQGRRIPLVRDAESERLIADYLRPLFKAAGLAGSSFNIKLVDDRGFNAFVADRSRVFVNTGALVKTETPGEMIGVLAHETAHLAGGHLARQRTALKRARVLAAIAMIGGAAAGIAGGNAEAGAAAGLSGAQIGERGFLAYLREEETIADRAALTYLEKSGQSPRGMLTVFARLANDDLFSSFAGSDPFARTHPMAGERLAMLEELARSSPYLDRADDAALAARHALVRAKIFAYTHSADATLRAYPASDQSLPALYARTIASYRRAALQEALAGIDALIARAPDNPFFLELKGQMLLESGDARGAIAPLRAAVRLAPKEGLIRVLLGRALVGAEDPALLKEAVEALTRGLGDDLDQPIAYRQLALAHARLGDTALADLATAEGAFAEGDLEGARMFAARAQEKLKPGSPAWLRADDLITHREP